MKLHGFMCASPLFPDDRERDRNAHEYYLKHSQASAQEAGVELTVIQNGCSFSTKGLGYVRNPVIKSLAYNWLVCDANCQGDYWLFLPEDCVVKPKGWQEIRRHMEKGKACFSLSKDPKGFVGKRGLFQDISSEVQTLCDMNFLGKELGCVVLRGELDQKGFHCITKNWGRLSRESECWGNELYQTINLPDHPDINRALRLPIFQDYGFDGWKASTHEIETTFMKIVSRGLERQRSQADSLKSLISHYGPLISRLPYKGGWSELWDRIRK
ncbi:hypothetical protein [Candidatus Nitronereus thalassa]|uniref:Uncharacterized protein n=1 Tax=Candidatus Nitronereus thalassa TaxID=3020898 RepID=A0ABU3K5Z3_9BACT|nr:hypothetical protein [Candidatus Nitronereus thalassa]MDT7041801.1 hypothetical protein [Candidatus Nitronereus thalassa]